MVRFVAHNGRQQPVGVFANGTAQGQIPAGGQGSFTAPEGQVWKAEIGTGDVAEYEVSSRVPTWQIPETAVRFAVPLRPVQAGLWNESLDPDPAGRFLPGTGKLKAVLLFVEFDDATASGEPWGDPGDIATRVVGDAEEQIRKSSFDALQLAVDRPRLGWRNTNDSVQSYRGDLRLLVEKAAELFENDVDFNRYDIVYIVVAKSDHLGISPPWVAEPGDPIQTASGEIRHAVIFGKDSYDPINETFLLLHETYHLLGLPDLYDGGEVSGNGYSDGGLGEWDLMANQEGDSSLLGWHRLKLGWLAQSQVLCFKEPGILEIDLADWTTPDGIKAVMSPVSFTGDVEDAHLAYLVEVANPRCGGASPGVLVFSVNAALPSWERPIQIRGGLDALSAKPIPVGGCYKHLSDVVEVCVQERLPNGGFRVRVEKKF